MVSPIKLCCRYEMFQRIVEQEKAVVLFQTKDTGREFVFSMNEWDLAKAVVELLRPAYQATVEISGEKYVSGSKVIPLTKALFNFYYTKEAEYMDAPFNSFKSRE